MKPTTFIFLGHINNVNMKKLILAAFTLVLGFSAVYGQDFLPATVEYKDGTKAELLFRYPYTNHTNFVVKQTKESKKEKILQKDVERVIFKGSEETGPRVLVMQGRKISGYTFKPVWMFEISKGTVTLYAVGGASIAGSVSTGTHTVTDIWYFVKREGETDATCLGTEFISGAIGIGEDKKFRRYASEYFSD